MGYESRLIIVDRISIKSRKGEYVMAEEIARFNLCCVPWNHGQIFTTPIDFDIQVTDGERVKYKKTDCYGEHCHMADLDIVIREIERLSSEDSYRRYKPILGLLKGFDPGEWNELKVVHYGY